MSKPTLDKDAPVLVEMFAAGGGIATAAVLAGIRPVVSIEHDPTKPELSKAMLEQHRENFLEYGGTILQQTVQSVDWRNIKELHPQVDFLHASPVCSNFSIAKTDGKETDIDLECAIAVAKAIEMLQPSVFSLEQVPAYKDSQSWEVINNKLAELEYNVSLELVNFKNLGLPQSRTRMVVRASKQNIPSFPKQQLHRDWYETIKDLIPGMTDSSLLPKQQEAVDFTDKNQPLFMYRVGNDANRCKCPGQAIGTITRSIFTDQKGNNRSKFANVWLPDGTVKDVSIRAVARLQGFPDWYKFSDSAAVAGSSIGYSCPPLPFSEIFKGLLPLVQRSDRHEYDFYESPIWFTNELLKRQHIEGTVLEPCVGHGAIADILKLSPYITNVFTNDFDLNKQADFHYDASQSELWEKAPTPDWVITNPPYSNGMINIIKHSLSVARKGVAMFCRLSLLEPCENRADLPSPNKVFILPRFCFRKSKHGKWATDSSTIAIFIWDKTTQGQIIESINKSDIDLFYRTPEEIHQINIQDYFTKSNTSVNIKKTVVEKKAAVKAATIDTTGEKQMFNNELQLMKQELEDLNNQIDKTSELNEKASQLETLIIECMELAQAAGLSEKFQENIAKLVFGDSVKAVQTQEIEQLGASEPESQPKEKEKLPSGMTNGTYRMIKKEVKEKLGLGVKTKCPTVKNSLLDAIADSNYDDEEKIEQLNSVELDSVEFWLVSREIINNLSNKTEHDEETPKTEKPKFYMALETNNNEIACEEELSDAPSFSEEVVGEENVPQQDESLTEAKQNLVEMSVSDKSISELSEQEVEELMANATPISDEEMDALLAQVPKSEKSLDDLMAEARQQITQGK